MNDDTSADNLREAMYELALAARIPDGDLVEDLVRRYPEHAQALTDFAIWLAVDALSRGDEIDEQLRPSIDAVSPTVSRVMSRFQNRLFELRHERTKTEAQQDNVTNPFEGLDRQGLRSLAARIRANTELLAKFRDRQVDFGTIPQHYVRCLAGEMDVSLDTLSMHLSSQSDTSLGQQFFNADGKQTTAQKETFEEAVRSSLSEEEQKALLDFLKDI